MSEHVICLGDHPGTTEASPETVAQAFAVAGALTVILNRLAAVYGNETTLNALASVYSECLVQQFGEAGASDKLRQLIEAFPQFLQLRALAGPAQGSG